jgi:ParB-like chromosome segregation protein Spo0J
MSDARTCTYAHRKGGAVVSKVTHQKLPDWETWFERVTRGETQQQIGDRLGVSRSTVARWVRHGVLEPNELLALARAYKTDPIEGLLASGWLTMDDMKNGGMTYIISCAPTRMLVNELYKRFGGQ